MSTSTIPSFELRDGRVGTVDLVAKVDGADVVVVAGLVAGDSGAGTDDPYAYAVRVAIVAADGVIGARVRTASASAYASKPDTARERWFESSDGGRSWRPRTGALGGAEVAQLARGQVAGWNG